MRLLGVTAYVVLSLIWGILIARIYGQHQDYLPMEHPFLKKQLETIAHRGGGAEAPENTFAAFDHALKLNPETILWVNVRQTGDQNFVLITEDLAEKTTDGKGRIIEMTLAEIKKLDAGYRFSIDEGKTFPFRGKGLKVPTLKEALEKYPDTRFILDIKSNTLQVDVNVIQIIKEAKANSRVLIQSDYGAVVQHSRKLEPRWLFGNSIDELTRSIMLLNIYLEPVDSLRADIFMLPLKYHNAEIYSDRLRTEIQRRYKKVFMGPINDESTLREFSIKPIDGIITDRPTLLREVLKSTHATK